MHSRQLFAFISASLAATTLAFTVAVKAPLDNYTVFIPEWEVEATPGGEKIILHGTVHEVLYQLRAINPDYDAAFNLDLNLTDPVGHETRALEKRADFDEEDVVCNKLKTDGKVDAIAEGIKYLRKVPGKPKNGPGPGNCGRVSCSYGSAIWWCNDDDKPKELKDFGEIADGAEAVWKKCTDVKFRFWYSNGQAFHKDNWNVMCNGDPC